MKLLPFKDLIAMSKEALDSAMAPIRARQVRSQAELEMAQLDAEILTVEREVQEMCTEKKIDFGKLIDKLDKAALLERRKAKYDEVLQQLFPEAA
jgi:hypothetical protein